ncbi:hypothetical protein N0B31_02780 [Salinirubellus salinus]|uniref:Uncharacterized protein n=1 Tax=Salinirubellus salinus TaxID=1364945 RepID=A0A9E7U8V0_9EURY|nr:hypothetical protein [Salinirubellus salinus]UWM55216.1 hypothetical protein N0B31_02780 [Salinirubellus salinus]
MAGYASPGGGGFDYVQPGEPNNPQLGDLWFDTDAGSDGSGEAKVFDSTGWVVTGYASHTDLMDIGADDHHSPVTVSDPLTENGTQGLGLSIGDGVTLSGGALVAALSTGLTIDGGGNVRVAPEGITNALIAADAVGSSQIQAGAVRHGTEADTPSDAHHSRYTDGEASNAAPVQSVDGQTGDVDTGPSFRYVTGQRSADWWDGSDGTNAYIGSNDTVTNEVTHPFYGATGFRLELDPSSSVDVADLEVLDADGSIVYTFDSAELSNAVGGSTEVTLGSPVSFKGFRAGTNSSTTLYVTSLAPREPL